MTQEEKRILLAEAAGWTKVHESWTGQKKACIPNDSQRLPLPDYFHDLNAVHELWTILIKGRDELEDKLSIELLRQIGSDDPSDGGRPNGSDATWALASNATASQRAEALGLTLNIWKA